jgi:hypothetical protein
VKTTTLLLAWFVGVILTGITWLALAFLVFVGLRALLAAP